MLNRINLIEEKYNVKILYACYVGSKLYGTFKENKSDLDVRFIFVHNKERYLLKTDIDSIKENIVSKNKDGKNDENAVDFDGWSIHNFFNLLKKGETNAIDLLFSTYNEQNIIYQQKDFVKSLQNNKDKLINKNMKSFTGYAVGQIKKFGIKGQRYEELDSFVKYVQTIEKKDLSMNEYYEQVKEHIVKNNYKYIKYEFAPAPRGNKETVWEYLSVLGKLFSNNVSVSYVYERIEKLYSSFGNRTKTVAKTKTKTDFKALSHSLRIIKECKQLLKTKQITFPLEYSQEIKKIKYYDETKYSEKENEDFVNEIIQEVENQLSQVDILVQNSKINENSDQDTINSILLKQIN